MAKNLSEQAA